MIIRFIALISLISLVFSGSAIGENRGDALIVRSDRPRVLIDSTDLMSIKARLSTSGKEDFRALRNYSLRRLVNTPAGKLIESGYDPKMVASVAFVGLAGKDEQLSRLAIDYALTMGRTPPDSGDDNAQRNRLLSMSYVYDWLHEKLPVSAKSIIRDGIIAHIKHLRYFLDDPLYTGGHSRYGSATIMAGLIALSDEDWPNERKRLLKVIKIQWETGYNPFQACVAAEGGYHMGWRYGPSYTDPLPYLLWEKATGVRWGEEWRRNQIYWLIYGIRGDGTLPRSGDCWDTSLQDDIISAIVATSAGVFKNRHAEWFYRNYFADNWEPRRLFRLLFQDPLVSPLAPSDSLEGLPLTRQFSHAGFVVARDSWDTNATQLVFKSAPFYSRNHQHKDQNHIELSYKGSLLIDSGYYDYFGSPHWKNYYTRSIAHNTLLVYDPEETFVDDDQVVNDGGQAFPSYFQFPVGREPKSLQEVSSEKYKLGGIVGFGSGKGASWVRGDATNAYSRHKINSYIRDILMVNRPNEREHPFILILDRVSLKKNLKPAILFHANERPVARGNLFDITNPGGGIIHGEILSPANCRLALIGGLGKEWSVNGTNYPPSRSWKDAAVDVGAWRIEAQVKDKTDTVQFITFLAVDDLSSFKGRPIVTKISGEDYAGGVADKTLMLIYFGTNPPVDWKFTGEIFEKVEKIFVAGLEAIRPYQFHLNGKVFKSSDSSVIVFPLSGNNS